MSQGWPKLRALALGPAFWRAENPYQRPVIEKLAHTSGQPCAICGVEDAETAGQLGAWRASMARLAASAEIHPSICASMLEELRAVQLAAKVRTRRRGGHASLAVTQRSP